MLIFLWVKNELSYDNFHHNADNIYRLVTVWKKSGESTANSPGKLAAAIKAQVPEVELAARVHVSSDQSFYRHGDKTFYEDKSAYVDPEFFQIFNFPAVKGDSSKWFDPSRSLVITRDIAEKYFGKEDALGETLTWNNRQDDLITGVIENFPDNSHLQFDFLYSHRDLSTYWKGGYSWTNFVHSTYVQLKPGADPVVASEKITQILFDNATGVEEEVVKMYLQPLNDVYLNNEVKSAMVQGNGQYVRIFSLAGIAILIIACINFINLSTAHAAKRAREVGVKKTLGASRSSLVRQFFSESILAALASFVIAMLIVELSLPAFNDLVQKNINIDYYDLELIAGFTLLVLATGFISGIYPALFLSSFKTVNVLKGSLPKGQGELFRKFLVVVQFTVSILLIIGAVVVYNQLEFMQNKNLGFDKENLIYIPAQGNIGKNYETISHELLSSPYISGVTIKESIPMQSLNNSYVSWPGKNPDVNQAMETAAVGINFMEVMGVSVIEGRNFSRDYNTDVTEAFIINEKAAEVMGLSSAVGMEITTMGRTGKIVGVIKDANFKSLHQAIEPQVFYVLEDYENPRMRLFGIVLIKIKEDNLQQALSHVSRTVQLHNPAVPFEYHFLDETIEKQYAFEKSLSTISNCFGGLAIFVSCLGLLGLISFTTEQKEKELSIRKILGASWRQLMAGLLKTFVLLVFIAWVVAAPLGYLFAYRWLETFSYKIELNLMIFVLAGAAALLLSILIIGTHVVKAITANPVDSLRQE